MNKLIKYGLQDIGFLKEDLCSSIKRLNNLKSMFGEYCGMTELYQKTIWQQENETIKDIRKELKRLMKLRKSLPAKLLTQNTHYHSDDGTDGIWYWAFAKGCTEDDIINYLEKIGVEVEGREIYSMYDCTGKLFKRSVYIYEKKNTIVASQSWGYDV